MSKTIDGSHITFIGQQPASLREDYGKTCAVESLKDCLGCDTDFIERQLDVKSGTMKTYQYAQGVRMPDIQNLNESRMLIIGGSQHDVKDREVHAHMPEVISVIQHAIEHKIPVFGICGGHQMIARALSGNPNIVVPVGLYNFGMQQIEASSHQLFEGLAPHPYVTMSHSFCVDKDITEKAPGAQIIATSHADTIVQALAYAQDGNIVWSTQYHPEMIAGDLIPIMLMRKERLISNLFGDEGKFNEAYTTYKNFDKPDAGKTMLQNFYSKAMQQGS